MLQQLQIMACPSDMPPIVAVWTWPTWYQLLLLLAIAAYGVSMLFDPRRKELIQLASELGLEFSPKISPERIGTRGTTFDAGRPAENCLRGVIAGQETAIFDLCMRERTVGGFSDAKVPGFTGTFVGFRVPADRYCRSRDILKPERWHVEKMGEWVFVIDLGRPHPVRPRKITGYVEEARIQFQHASDPDHYEPTLLPGVL